MEPRPHEFEMVAALNRRLLPSGRRGSSDLKAPLTIEVLSLAGFLAGSVPMLPHVFSYDGATYAVWFKRVDDQWRAALYRREDSSIRALTPKRRPKSCLDFPNTQFVRGISLSRNGW
jgi:hypothetical protein